MTYVLSFGAVILALIKKKSRILTVIMIMIMWFLFGWNSDNPDYANYLIHYQSTGPIDYSKEVGFQVLTRLFNNLGLDYNHFLITISLIGLLLIVSTIKRYTKNPSFVLVLYFIFPFLLDIVQIRNFLAMSIVIFGVRYLIDNGKLGSIKYIICVLFAGTFHFVALFYLIFLLTKMKNILYLTLFIVSSTLISILFSYTEMFQKIAYELAPSAKTLAWFDNRIGIGILVIILVHIGTLFLIYYCYKWIRNNITNEKSINFIIFVLKINIICLVIFLFYTFNMTFFRIYRNMFILNYIMFAIYLFDLKINKDERLIFKFLVIIFVFMMAFIYIIIPNFDDVFISVFKNNTLFGGN